MSSFTLSNFSGNIIQIENKDLSNPLLYTFYVLGDNDTFAPVINYPTDPTKILAAGATVSLDMITDGVYKFIVAASPNSEYIILLDANIKVCAKNLMQKVLCNPCDTHDDCNKVAYLDNIYQLMKFNVVKDNIYYLFNKYYQTQSISDIITVPNGEISFLSDLVKTMNLLCNNCQEGPCFDVYNADGSPNTNCNCHK